MELVMPAPADSVRFLGPRRGAASDIWDYGDARLVREDVVEFRQPGSWLEAVLVDESLSVLFSSVAVSMPILGGYLAVVLGQMIGYELLFSATGGDVEFAIDQPLRMGGNVLSCCIRNADTRCGVPESVDCWSSDPPDRAVGCCGSPSSSSGGGGGGGGGGGTSGFGLPPIVVIGVPYIPFEDSDTLYVDGTQVA